MFDVIDGLHLARSRVFREVLPGASGGFRIDFDGNLFASSHDSIQVYAPDGCRLGNMPMHLSILSSSPPSDVFQKKKAQPVLGFGEPDS